jgi:hypothetical protein
MDRIAELIPNGAPVLWRTKLRSTASGTLLEDVCRFHVLSGSLAVG